MLGDAIVLQALHWEDEIPSSEGLAPTQVPDRLPELSRGATRVWDAVEFLTVHVHAAYLDEVAVLARQRERERTALVGRLLSSDGRDQQLVGQVATLLNVDAQAHFAVVAVSLKFQQDLRRVVATRLAAQAPHVQEHSNGILLLIARLPMRTTQVPATWFQDLPCAVAPVAHGLADVPAMARVAETVAAALDSAVTGPVTLGDAWMPVAVASLGDVAALLAEAVLSPLDALPEPERERLLETVVAYCRSGSIAETTRELYVHRNTVLNRLNRFTDLTGYEPTRPTDAATVLFALRCRGTCT